MDVAFLVAWEWFQSIAIRLALFLALLTLGPSIGLIVLDLLLYAFRTTYDNVTFTRKNKDVPKLIESSDDEEESEKKSEWTVEIREVLVE
jgi:hypothetical protein